MSNKPVPSDSIEDLKLNVLVEDVVVTSREKEHTPDRLGVERLTLFGMEKMHERLMAGQSQAFSSFMLSSEDQFQRFMDSSGYYGWDTQYAAGIVLNSHNQGFTRCEPDGTACMFYTPLGTTPLPYTTTGDWASESALFVARSADDVLRQDLASTSDFLKGSSLIGYRGRTVFARLNEVVYLDDYPAIGDGESDDTPYIMEALNDAKGRTLVLGRNKQYRFTDIEINSPLTLISNGSSFVKKEADDSYSFRILADNFKCDSLAIFHDYPRATATRGIKIIGNDLIINFLTIKAKDPGTSASSSQRCALSVGDDGVVCKRIDIGFIEIENFDRPMELRGVHSSRIGYFESKVYVRAIYIRNCKNIYIDGGYTSETSINSNGGPGENSILMESQEGKYATENIYIRDFSSNNSGEHGFRLGGSWSIRNVFFDNCSSFDSGASIKIGNPSATEWHGGCGFKILGGTVRANEKHENIHLTNCTVEDCNVTTGGWPSGHGHGNYAGYQVAVANGVHLTNCTLKKRNQPVSCGYGVELLAAENVTFTDCDFRDYSVMCYRIYEADGGYPGWALPCENIMVSGGFYSGAQLLNIRVSARNHRKIMLDGVSCNSTVSQVIRVELPDLGGSVEDSRFDVSIEGVFLGSAQRVYGTANILLNIYSPWNPTGSFPQAKAGSLWTDTITGELRVKRTVPGWNLLNG